MIIQNTWKYTITYRYSIILNKWNHSLSSEVVFWNYVIYNIKLNVEYLDIRSFYITHKIFFIEKISSIDMVFKNTYKTV